MGIVFEWILEQIISGISSLFLDGAMQSYTDALENTMVGAVMDWFVGLSSVFIGMTATIMILNSFTNGQVLTTIRDVVFRMIFLLALVNTIKPFTIGLFKMVLTFAMGLFGAAGFNADMTLDFNDLSTSSYGMLLVTIGLIIYLIFLAKYYIEMFKYVIAIFVQIMVLPFHCIEIMTGGNMQAYEYIMGTAKIYITVIIYTFFLSMGLNQIITGIVDVKIGAFFFGMALVGAKPIIEKTLGSLGLVFPSGGGGFASSVYTVSAGANLVSGATRMFS